LASKERVPSHFVAIGLDFTTLHVCLSCLGADKGKVICWDSFGGPETPETLYNVADSFEAFWASLRQSEADVSWETVREQPRTIVEQSYTTHFHFRPLLAVSHWGDIIKTEKRLRLEFPPDYRQFLVEWNGGYYVSDSVGFQVHGHIFIVDALFGVGPYGTLLHVHGITDYFSKRLPTCSAVIGKTLDHHLIILLCEGEPGIYITREPSSAHHVKVFGLQKLADRFEEFWHLLKCIASVGWGKKEEEKGRKVREEGWERKVTATRERKVKGDRERKAKKGGEER